MQLVNVLPNALLVFLTPDIQRTIIYATNDLTILQTLKANSIWGRGEQHTWCKWPEAITNSAVYQAAAFEFVFVTSQQALQFHQKLQQCNPFTNCPQNLSRVHCQTTSQ